MRNIEKTKKQILQNFVNKYGNKKEENLTEKELNKYSSIAEWWAYIDSVIPEGFGGYTIFDFNGCAVNVKDGNKNLTIPKQVAAVAKDKVCMYCWGMSWKEIYQQNKNDKESIRKFLNTKSVMKDRIDYGNNIVIHGLSDKPIGRTMIASIVMKEAMRLRVTHHLRGHTYDWVDFSKLFQAIEEDTMELADYKSCDWLVVDNIIKKTRSEKQSTLISDRIDPFFIDRFYNKQPTILVFKFDIRDTMLDLEKMFGVGIRSIVESKRTFKIPLSENLLNE